MNPMQTMVHDFHNKCGVEGFIRPTVPDPRTLLLRARLIVEEAGEFLKAASHEDMVEMIDALCDILYVTFGTADVMGVDLEPFFNEVQRSNMTKEDKDASGKVRKGPDFSPPDLASILHQEKKSHA